jgi:hypothetical protein
MPFTQTPDLFITHMIDTIHVDFNSRGLSSSVLAVVPVTPWHLHVGIPTESYTLFQACTTQPYTVLESKPFDESDPVWNFWKSIHQSKHGDGWRPEAVKSIQSKYNIARELHRDSSPELLGWFQKVDATLSLITQSVAGFLRGVEYTRTR